MKEIIEVTEEGMYDLINELLKNNYLQEVEFLKKNDEYKVYNKAIEMLLRENNKLKEDKYKLITDHIKSLENDKNNMLEIQKELDRLTGLVDTMSAEFERLENIEDDRDRNYISKDKIKEKIEKLTTDICNSNDTYTYRISMEEILDRLQELLEND